MKTCRTNAVKSDCRLLNEHERPIFEARRRVLSSARVEYVRVVGGQCGCNGPKNHAARWQHSACEGHMPARVDGIGKVQQVMLESPREEGS